MSTLKQYSNINKTNPQNDGHLDQFRVAIIRVSRNFEAEAEESELCGNEKAPTGMIGANGM